MSIRVLLLLVAFAAVLAVGYAAVMPEYSSILLTDVKALTLYKDKYTTARRVEPILQVQCLGGAAQYATQYHPDVVQCHNVGTDDKGEVQWQCTAELEPEVKFGRLEVNCEGYNYAEDPYILQGSCGMAYTLEYTAYYYQQHPTAAKKTWGAGGVAIFVVMIIIFMAIGFFCPQNKSRSTTYGTNNGFWTGFVAGAASRSGGYRSSSVRSSSSRSSSRSSSGFGGTKRR